MPEITLLDSTEFKKKAKDKKEGEPYGIRKYHTLSSVEVVKGLHDDEDEATRVLRFIITTEGVDRDNDTISVAGWNVENFLKNPVVLFGHDSRKPPVAKALNLIFGEKSIKSDAEFMHRDISEFSNMIFEMYKQHFMNAISVGFSPEEFNFDEERGGFGINFIRQELLEYSTVPVPANPEALQLARKGGINTLPLVGWAEQILDGDKSLGIYMPKSTIESMYKNADGKSKVTIWMGDNDVLEFKNDKKELPTMADKGNEKDKTNSIKAVVDAVGKIDGDNVTEITIDGDKATIKVTPVKTGGDQDTSTGAPDTKGVDDQTNQSTKDADDLIEMSMEDLADLTEKSVEEAIRKHQGKLD